MRSNVRSGPSLQDFPSPDAAGQRAVTLACAGARTLARVAILRSPIAAPPLVERLESLEQETFPLPASRLVPVALSLCQEDPDGRAVDASLAWLAANDSTELRGILARGLAARRRWHGARANVVRANLRLAASIVYQRYMRSGVDFEDLFQEAVFGVVKAADRFDPNYGVKFSTYATWWVRNAVQRYLQNSMRLVRLPVKICDHLSRCRFARLRLGHNATEEAIAKHTSLTLERVIEIQRISSTKAAHPVSLDHPAGPSSDRDSMISLIPAEVPDLDAAISAGRASAHLEALLADLPPRSRFIIEQRFGLQDDRELTLASIGHQLGISRERVRQIEKVALHDLHVRAARTQCPTSHL